MIAVLRALVGLSVVVALALVGLHAALLSGSFTPRIEAALERATGRAVTLGPIGLHLAFPPTISATDVTIANVPGGTAADFARIGQLDITVALRPLLAGEFEIEELAFRDAELFLERDAAGLPNWRFGGAGGAGGAVTVQALRIEASRLHLPESWFGIVDVATLTVRRGPGDDALRLDARVALRGEAVALDAALGRISQATSDLTARITGTGFRLAASGEVARSLDQPSWSLAIEAEAESVARLMQLVGAEAGSLPLGRLRGTARLGPGLAISDISVASAEADLGAMLPGLRLREASLTAAGLDAPMRIEARGQRSGADASLEVSMASPRIVFAGAAATPWPVTAALTAGPVRITTQGRASRADPFGAAPHDVTIAAPSLRDIGPLLGMELPDLRGFRASGRIARGPSGGLRTTGLRVTAAPLQASGALDIAWGPRLVLSGQLSATRLDLDALSGPSAPRPDGMLIPDAPLPIAALRAMDGVLNLSAETMTAAGLAWRAVNVDAALTAGRLNLRSFSATSPGGPISGRLTLDAAATPPAVTLTLQSGAAGLDLSAIRRELGAGIGLQGPVEIAMDLRGRGDTTRALAATLSGEAGMAMVGGQLAGAGMLRVGPDLTRILLLGNAPPEGVPIRCLALRMNLEQGLAQSEALLLESGVGRIDGTLAINLRTEAVAARLRPDIRMLGTNMRTHVGIGGTLAAPRVEVEPGQAVAQLLGDTVTNRLWRSSTLEWLRGGEGGPAGEDCVAQLRLARLGRPGRAPAPASTTIIPLVPRELQSPVQDVFRGIGGLLGGRR